MEFKEAMRIWMRMCKTKIVCNDCELRDNCIVEKDAMAIDAFETEAILAKWAAEHPEKTISDDFFEKHPKAKYVDNMVPGVCAFYCGYDKPEYCQRDAAICAKCWRRPLEEVER